MRLALGDSVYFGLSQCRLLHWLWHCLFCMTGLENPSNVACGKPGVYGLFGGRGWPGRNRSLFPILLKLSTPEAQSRCDFENLPPPGSKILRYPIDDHRHIPPEYSSSPLKLASVPSTSSPSISLSIST